MARLNKSVIFLFLLVIMSGCNVQTKDIQLIEIDALPDKEQNDKVAQALMHYTPAYFMHHIPSLTKENGSGVQPGYVRKSDANISYFRVFYVTSNENLKSSSVASIKREFERHIPIMAGNHASAWELQEKESITKGKWLKEFLNSRDPSEYIDDISKDFPRKYHEYFITLPQSTQNKLGLVSKVNYQRYQYYKPFGEFKEQLVLTYKVSFDKGRIALVNLSLDKRQEVMIVEILPLKA